VVSSDNQSKDEPLVAKGKQPAEAATRNRDSSLAGGRQQPERRVLI